MQATQDAQQKAEEARFGWSRRPHETQCLHVRVGEGHLQRALRIMDTLIKTLEAQGHQVDISGNDYSRSFTRAVIFGQPIRFGLAEGGSGLRLFIDEWGHGLRRTWAMEGDHPP